MQQDILFLPISGPRGASSRYRLFQFLPAITDAGWTYSVHLPPESPGSGFRRLLTALRERRKLAEMVSASRGVFLQKRLLPESQITALARARPLLFDFDDAIFTSPSGKRSGLAQRRVENRLKAVLSEATLVVAGNRYLCDYAGQYSDQVIHLPTVIDTSRYPARQHADTEEIVIGWIGHSVNHPYLAGLGDVLRNTAKHFRVRLLVVSDRDLAIPGVTVENRRWSEETEVADILRMDIGIMPMPDDAWSRGKCGFKAIQYMAAGIPVVCAAVGANREIVRHNVDGYVVTTLTDWVAAIADLCSSVERRVSMGESGRHHVVINYSLGSTIPKFISQLRTLVP